MLPVSLIFTSGVASGVNSYAVVLVAWHRRRDARLGRRSSGGRMAGVPSPLL
jgi:hypothetical protein